MTISTNPKPTIYRNLYDKNDPEYRERASGGELKTSGVTGGSADHYTRLHVSADNIVKTVRQIN